MATGMLINFSEMDYNAYDNDTDCSMHSDETPLADPIFAPYTPQPSSKVGTQEEDVLLEVSGNSFIMNAADFQKLARLPWQKIHATAYRLESSLSPDTFEKCVDYIQAGTLPKRKKMKTAEKAELVSTATTLGLRELVVHMNSKKSGFFGRK